jgi:hypothetical protein
MVGHALGSIFVLSGRKRSTLPQGSWQLAGLALRKSLRVFAIGKLKATAVESELAERVNDMIMMREKSTGSSLSTLTMLQYPTATLAFTPVSHATGPHVIKVRARR